jgi:hypothetical protein
MNNTKVWIAVDEDGSECIYSKPPVRWSNSWDCRPGNFVDVPNGTAFKLTGLRLTWEHEPVCLGCGE